MKIALFNLLSLPYGAMRNLCNGLIALSLFCAAAQAAPVTIVALGDSLTAGYGLPPEDGLVPQLQRWLDAREADITLINAGVSGDTTAGGLSRLDWSLTPETQALIVALGGNDMLRGLPPTEARKNLGAILAGAKAKGLPSLLVGLPAPSNYGPAYQSDFNAVYTDLAAEYGADLMPNYFAALGAGPDLAALMQADGIHPNAAGVAKIVESIGPYVIDIAAKAVP